ncbi:MAG: transporter substrate-binding domain-containing protein [Aggregatilineales bacterium]
MMKFARLLPVFLLLLSAMFVMAQDDEMELPDLEGRTITVAVENAYFPFNFIDEESGEAQGWDYDTINELCNRLNCTPEYVETSWDGMIIAVSNGEYDMAADGISITDERAEVVDFSMAYYQVDQLMLTRLEEDRFGTIEDFQGGDFVIGVQVATTNEFLAVDLVGEDRVIGYETFGVAVQALINGDVDGVVMDDASGMGYVGVNSESVTAINEALYADALGFIYPKDSDLVTAVDAGLQSMMDDGTLDEINTKWFSPAEEEGDDMEDMADLPDLEGRTITVAVENAYFPFNFIDEESGEAQGWDYDTINELCNRLNCTPEYVETSWDGMIIAVSNGEYDMAADGISITDERAEVVDFSMAYYEVDQLLLTGVGEDRFASVEDFQNGDFVIGVQVATTNEFVAIDLVGEDRVIGYETFGVAVQALINGDVDGVVMDDASGMGYVGVNSESVTAINEPIKGDSLGFIYPNDSDLVTAVDAGLQSMMDDGTLQEINDRWFTTSTSDEGDDMEDMEDAEMDATEEAGD